MVLKKTIKILILMVGLFLLVSCGQTKIESTWVEYIQFSKEEKNFKKYFVVNDMLTNQIESNQREIENLLSSWGGLLGYSLTQEQLTEQYDILEKRIEKDTSYTIDDISKTKENLSFTVNVKGLNLIDNFPKYYQNLVTKIEKQPDVKEDEQAQQIIVEKEISSLIKDLEKKEKAVPIKVTLTSNKDGKWETSQDSIKDLHYAFIFGVKNQKEYLESMNQALLTISKE